MLPYNSQNVKRRQRPWDASAPRGASAPYAEPDGVWIRYPSFQQTHFIHSSKPSFTMLQEVFVILKCLRKKKTDQRVWKGFLGVIWPNFSQSTSTLSVTLVFQACVHLGLNHLWGQRLHSLSGHHPIFWLPSLLNISLLHTHVSSIVVVFVASHHPTSLIKLLQKLLGCPQSQPCSRMTKPRSPSLSLQGKCFNSTVLETSLELPPSYQYLSCTADQHWAQL